MGERLNGIQEVGSSILPGSTKENLKKRAVPTALFLLRRPMDKSLAFPIKRVFSCTTDRLEAEATLWKNT
jgi:hypothetical protein